MCYNEVWHPESVFWSGEIKTSSQDPQGDVATDATPAKQHPRDAQASRALIVVATYNEIENLPRLVAALHEHQPGVDILVIDDNSPDGTGQWCEDAMLQDKHLHCIHRSGKLGLGSATVAGMTYALENGYEYVLTMDADFSHPPANTGDLLQGVSREEEPVDVMIGSRYVKHGAIEGWPLTRRLMSRAVNLYARMLLGLPTRDCSGAFRCYRAEALRKIDYRNLRSSGYSYLEEILWLLKRSGATFAESPITFTDRVYGQTKINTREALAAIGIIFRLGVKNWLGF